MLCRFRVGTLAAATVMLLPLTALVAEAQMPDKFTNLQYFPKTISRQELVGYMRGFSFSLGVRCQFCHAGKEGNKLNQMDFASDEKDTKKNRTRHVAHGRYHQPGIHRQDRADRAYPRRVCDLSPPAQHPENHERTPCRNDR